MTVSTDGRILWWDTRRLAEPSDELILQNKYNDGRFGALSLITTLQWAPQGKPYCKSRFMLQMD